MEMTRADLKARQFQRLLGPVWWIIEPSIMSIAYFMLTMSLKYSTGQNHFMFIFIATTIWKAFTRPLELSLFAYVSFSGVIRQISFPLVAVNVTHLVTELFFFGVGFFFIFILGMIFGLPFGASLIGLVPLIICQILITFGLMICIACLGVYLRDLQGFMSLGLNFLFIMSPGIYDADALPRVAQKVSVLNPFYYLFPAYREILIKNKFPDYGPCLLWSVIGLILIYFSTLLYRRVRPGFLRVL